MSATDELRRLLDERGVEHEGGERSLRWRDRYGIMMQAFPLANGELGMDVWSCTPEQAIAATLGVSDATQTRQRDAGTCHLEEIEKDCDTASEYMLDREWCIDAVYRCSCGCTFGHVAHDRPRYCPACGRKVIEPTTNNVDAEVDE